MFELRNENQVWYKTSDMIEWIHYGNIQTVSPCEENQYCIKKFNMENGNYEVDMTVTMHTFNGIEYEVVDGYFTVVPTPEPIPVPTTQELVNAEILLNQVTQEARLTAIDEALAVILLNSTGGVLNV